MVFSAIDIGTNSIRYMIARHTQGATTVLEQGGEITRIGKNLGKTGRIGLTAAAHSFSALKKYVLRSRHLKARHIAVVATSALRDASNGAAFVAKAQKKLGVPVTIIDGAREAHLAFLGVSRSLKVPDNTLVIDIGGGSTEFVHKRGKLLAARSLDIGAVRLTERFVKGDQHRISDYKRMDAFIMQFLLKNLASKEMRKPVGHLVGAGGTITTLAAIKLMLPAYSHERVHGLLLHKKEIEYILNLLVSMPVEERKRVTGLKPERADIIAAGIYILVNIMDLLRIDTITVSDRGILYGVLVESIEAAAGKKQ